MKPSLRSVLWATPVAFAATACGALAGLEDHELAPETSDGGSGGGGASGGGGGVGGDTGGGGEGGAAGFQVQMLADEQSRPRSIIVQGSNVFWATELIDQRGIWSASTDGSSISKIQAFENPTNNNPSNVFIGLAADSSYVYWTLNMDCDDQFAGVPWDGVQRSSHDGTKREFMWEECTRRPRAIVSDANYVFHTERWEIRRIQKDNLDWRLLAWDQNYAFDIAEQGDRVYWLAEYPDDTCVTWSSKETVDQNIYERLFCSEFQVSDRRPKALAVDEGYAYWVDDGEIHRVSTMAGPQVTSELLASPGGVLVDIAIDETHIYFTSSSTGTVARVPKPGGTVEDVALGQDSPRGVAVDEEAVYWTNFVGGQVMRARKP